MKKRFLSFVLAGILVLLMAFGVLPMSARAVLPVGFVESAFASYAMSSGYTFFSEEMDDPLFLGLFRELYDDFVTVKSALGQTIRRWDEYDNRDVYLDRSGNIVVSYGVAKDWSGAMEWIQSHYDIEDGDDTPVTIVSGDSDEVTNGNGVTALSLSYDEQVTGRNNQTFNVFTDHPIAYRNSDSLPLYVGGFTNRSSIGSTVLYTVFNNIVYRCGDGSFSPLSASLFYYDDSRGYWDSLYTGTIALSSFDSTSYPLNQGSYTYIDLPVSTLDPQGVSFSSMVGSGLASGLAVTIGQGVTDVAQGMTDEDAVVIGVGAVPGITEGEMADFIADGIRADTLEPTATITATDVIDTPVQPYPDIDGLGLPSLGAALTSRFPFCIPWDFVDTVQLLAADPVAPDFSFDLLPQRIRDYCHITASTEVRFNMGDPKFSKVGVFCRWGSLISFCFGLAVLTKRMIWTA